MRTVVRHTIITVAALFAGASFAAAQKYPERSDIRKGNRAYERGRYDESETRYRHALEENPESFEAKYNLGNALYRQGIWDGAETIFGQAAEDGISEAERFNSHFNAGNSMFQQRKLREALEEYKEALRIDPTDMEAKFNLAYVKKMLEDEEGDGGGDGDNENDDQDNNDENQGGGDNNSDQDQGNPDQNQGDGDNDDPQDPQGGDKPDRGEGQPQERPAGMTREEAENLLEAMQGTEDRAREKAEEKKAGTVQRSEKNW